MPLQVLLEPSEICQTEVDALLLKKQSIAQHNTAGALQASTIHHYTQTCYISSFARKLRSLLPL